MPDADHLGLKHNGPRVAQRCHRRSSRDKTCSTQASAKQSYWIVGYVADPSKAAAVKPAEAYKRKAPQEEGLDLLENKILKQAADVYRTIRPDLYQYLQPREDSVDMLAGPRLIDGLRKIPSEAQKMPFLGVAWGRFVTAVQHRDDDARDGLGMLLCVDIDNPNDVLKGSNFYFGGDLDILVEMKHGDVLLFDPSLQHSITEALYRNADRLGERPWRALLSFYLKANHIKMAACHPPSLCQRE